MKVVTVFTAMLLLSTATVADTIARCDGCGNVQMEATALLAYSVSEPTVHVVDSVNNRVRSYEVTFVTGGTGRDPLALGPEPVARLISTPADVQAGFEEAMKVLTKAKQATKIPKDTIARINGTGYVNSASDIIINRANLARVAGYLGNSPKALSLGAATKLFAKVINDVAMEITFSDGTTIQVTLRAVIRSSGVSVQLVYVEDSASTADHEKVPDSSDDFDGLQVALGGGTQGYPQFLGDLASFWDVPIVNASGSRIGGGSGSEYTCESTTTGVLCRKKLN